MNTDRPRGGLSVLTLLVLLVVPLIVGWCVERAAYGNARATEELLAPLGVAATSPPPAAPAAWHALGDPAYAAPPRLPSR
jgi:hypothetical protein